jgi:hypothetical protein
VHLKGCVGKIFLDSNALKKVSPYSYVNGCLGKNLDQFFDEILDEEDEILDEQNPEYF